MITIQDTIAPLVPNFPNNITVYLDADCQVDTTTLGTGDVSGFSDNCSSVTITYTDDLTNLIGCSGTGSFVRNWVAVDECNNETTAEQIITIQDTISPTFTAPEDITIYLSLIHI